jgi:hypothetical protein
MPKNTSRVREAATVIYLLFNYHTTYRNRSYGSNCYGTYTTVLGTKASTAANLLIP